MDSFLPPVVFEELLHRVVLTLGHENVGGVATRVDDTLRAPPLVIQRSLLLRGKFDARHGRGWLRVIMPKSIAEDRLLVGRGKAPTAPRSGGRRRAAVTVAWED